MPFWWFSKTARPEPVKYPPVAAGVPALPVSEILRPHEDLLARIRHLVEYWSDWERWYMPMIRRYAAYVHLLPASEHHHHRGAGGLLAHGLEVGLYTLQQAHDKLYGLHLEPKVRRLARPRWQYGCFVAGLCHDLGKPVALMRVTLGPEGGAEWQPFESDLSSWLLSHRAERYWVSFRRRRVADHERLAVLALDRVLSLEDRSYLGEHDPEMLLAVLATIRKEAQVEHEMGRLVVAADRKSVQEDLGRSNLEQDVGQNLGLPVMRILRDAMCRLVQGGVWQANVAGGRLWYMGSGLYLVWPQGAKDIGEELDRDEAYRGVPRRPQTLAEIMSEWRFIESGPDGSPYWWLRLEGQEKELLAVKVREPQVLLEVMPAPHPGEVRPYGLEEDQGGMSGPGSGPLVPEGPSGAAAALLGQDNQEESSGQEVPVSGAVAESPKVLGWRQRLQRVWRNSCCWLGRGVLAVKGGWRQLHGYVRGCVVSRPALEEGDQDLQVVAAELLGQMSEALLAQGRLLQRLQDQIQIQGEVLALLAGQQELDGSGEPAWVRVIGLLVESGQAMSELEAERLKRQMGGQGRLRDWFELAEDGQVLRRRRRGAEDALV